MKQQLNEIKRLQELAGVAAGGERNSISGEPYRLPESTENDIDLSDTPKFTSNPATKIKNIPILTLDRIAKSLSTTAKKRGCHDITKKTTTSSKDFSVYKYGAFSCDLSSATRRILQDLKVIGDDDDVDQDDFGFSHVGVYILLDRLKEKKLLHVEW